MQLGPSAPWCLKREVQWLDFAILRKVCLEFLLHIHGNFEMQEVEMQ